MTAYGYIVVAINFTGSTGYGQEFTDRIANEWGGRPFIDLSKGLAHVLAAYPSIDAERMSMLGSSYGGYMANWIQVSTLIAFTGFHGLYPEAEYNDKQGHNDELHFKAIVCQNGVFNTSNCWYTTDELYFAEREYGGTPWDEGTTYEKSVHFIVPLRPFRPSRCISMIVSSDLVKGCK